MIFQYRLYFLGIGGIGMSALARFFHHYAKRVHGYDKTETALTKQMVEEGISCYYKEDIHRLGKLLSSYKKEEVLVVITPAVPQDSIELKYLSDAGYRIMKRAEVLGEISGRFRTIAIAGTHGKTTTTTMVTHILKSAGINCFSFMGGISKNYDTNLLLGNIHDKDAYMVVEADEYDRSFLHLSPYISVITSTDADHLDIYGNAEHVKEGYSLFARQLREDGLLIVKNSVDNDLRPTAHRRIYSLNLDTEYCARAIKIEAAQFRYDIESPVEPINRVLLGLPGLHNVENSIAATAVAQQVGISADVIREALRSFKGVKRRFDYRVNTSRIVYIDDYAHHPEELKATIGSVRALYPKKRITGIFQPHLFTRTRDFAEGFATSLDLLDECILLDIYPAREKPLPGITSEWLLGKMKLEDKKLYSRARLLEVMSESDREVVLTMGAGDIDTLVEPIEKILRAL